ncbi:MAG: hypothetical protein O7E52_16955, partial [Candidatus Poribacteria bacterium]|nr:hypothetical protein [Candidatus Poribacteria bacterium]
FEKSTREAFDSRDRVTPVIAAMFDKNWKIISTAGRWRVAVRHVTEIDNSANRCANLAHGDWT